MQMDSNIILSGRSPDLVGAMERGAIAAGNVNGVRRQNALADVYRTQGAGIMAGDPGALNALAAFDPQAALGVQQTRQGMQADQQRMDILSREEQRQIADHAANMSAAERAEAAAQVESAVKAGLAIQDPQTWDAYMSQNAPDLVGHFGNRQMIANRYMSIADIIKGQAPADLTADQKDYNFYSTQEVGAGRKPLSFNEWTLQSKKAGATTVNVGGPQDPAAVADFNKDVKSANVQDVIKDIKDTMSGATLPTTGFVGSLISGVGGTAANDVRSNIDTLKAAASFSSLQAMRDASKTGAALGAVSDTEIKLLGAEIASLEQSQSPEQFAKNLDRFEKVYNEIVDGPQGAAPAASSGLSEGAMKWLED